MDKQFPIKHVWSHCKGKKGFKTYTYEKVEDEMSEYAATFPMMSAQELVDWAKACHPNVNIDAYDATYRKFMKHVHICDISLVYFVKRSILLSNNR